MLEGLERADDNAVWSWARDNGFVIVTKDSDVCELSAVRSAPPKILWLRVGNAGKGPLIRLLTENSAEVCALLADAGSVCIEFD